MRPTRSTRPILEAFAMLCTIAALNVMFITHNFIIVTLLLAIPAGIAFIKAIEYFTSTKDIK